MAHSAYVKTLLTSLSDTPNDPYSSKESRGIAVATWDRNDFGRASGGSSHGGGPPAHSQSV